MVPFGESQGFYLVSHSEDSRGPWRCLGDWLGVFSCVLLHSCLSVLWLNTITRPTAHISIPYKSQSVLHYSYFGFVLFCTDRFTFHEFHLGKGTPRRSRDKIRNSSIMWKCLDEARHAQIVTMPRSASAEVEAPSARERQHRDRLSADRDVRVRGDSCRFHLDRADPNQFSRPKRGTA